MTVRVIIPADGHVRVVFPGGAGPRGPQGEKGDTGEVSEADLAAPGETLTAGTRSYGDLVTPAGSSYNNASFADGSGVDQLCRFSAELTGITSAHTLWLDLDVKGALYGATSTSLVLDLRMWCYWATGTISREGGIDDSAHVSDDTGDGHPGRVHRMGVYTSSGGHPTFYFEGPNLQPSFRGRMRVSRPGGLTADYTMAWQVTAVGVEL